MADGRPGPGGVVPRYYLYKATVSTGFITPIFTLFLLFRQLSYTEIATLSMVYAVLTVLGEIPTGWVGDRIGRRNSLVVSAVAMVASILGFVVVESYLGLLVLYVLWAIALTFRSGSGDAWLYDTLAARDAAGTFTHVRGRGVGIQRAVTVLGMLVGGWLYSLDPRFPFLASGALNALAVPVLFSLPQNPQFEAAPEEMGMSLGDTLPTLRTHLATPAIGIVVVLVAVFVGVAGGTNTYIQPIAVGPLGFPESSLGLLYAGFTGVAAIAASASGWVEARIGHRPTLVAAPFLLGAVLVLPFVSPWLALPAFILMRGGRPLIESVAAGFLNERLPSVGRATLLSAASMVYAAAKLPFYLMGGVVADATTPILAVVALGLGAIGAAGGLLVIWRLRSNSS
jgi:MFS family permease